MSDKFRSYFIFFTIYFINKILVFAKEFLVVLYFGANFTTDCYYASIWYYQILFQILGTCFLQFVVVESKKYRNNKYDSTIFWGTFYTIFIFCIVIISLISPLTSFVGKHLPFKYIPLLKNIILFQLVNNVVLVYFMFKKIFLVSDGEFVKVSMLEMVYYGFSVLSFIVMYAMGFMNIFIAVFSTTIALFSGYIIFYQKVRKRIIFMSPFNSILLDSITKFIPIIFLLIVYNAYYFQMNYLVSSLGEKSITNLFWGLKLVESFMSLCSGFLTVILLPKLCDLSDSEIIENFIKKINTFIIFSITMFIIYLILSFIGIQILNKSSKYYSFIIYSYYFAFGLPAKIFTIIVIQYYFALRLYKEFSYFFGAIQISSIILNIALFYLIKLYGIGISAVISQYFGAYFMCWYLLKNKMKYNENV